MSPSDCHEYADSRILAEQSVCCPACKRGEHSQHQTRFTVVRSFDMDDREVLRRECRCVDCHGAGRLAQ
jgi:hypothetical protein